MIPGMMVIEKVHGLQCTGISLSERFALMMAEHQARVLRNRKRVLVNNQNARVRTWGLPNRMSLRLLQPQQQPVKQRIGMPGLRRFGSDGNLPGLKRSNSFSNLSQFRNRIPWRQSNSNLSRAGSVSSLSQASWHGNAAPVRARSVSAIRGRMRGRGRRQQMRQVGQLRPQVRAALPARGGGARGAGRGRGVARNQQNRNQQTRNQQNRNQENRNQQNRNQQNRNQQNRNQQNRNQQNRNQKNSNQLNSNQQNSNQQNRNQQTKPVPTKEELDAQLDEYMASSQFVLDKELEEYMLKGALMEVE